MTVSPARNFAKSWFVIQLTDNLFSLCSAWALTPFKSSVLKATLVVVISFPPFFACRADTFIFLLFFILFPLLFYFLTIFYQQVITRISNIVNSYNFYKVFMTSMSEKVNAVSDVIAKMTPDPAERFSVASVLVEMYRYEMNKAFVPMPDRTLNAP